MSEKNDNPPAFPFVEPPTSCNVNSGMTLRDYFAGQVLLGCCNDPTFVKRVCRFTGDDAEAGRAITADVAYGIADAMLAARKEPA